MASELSRNTQQERDEREVGKKTKKAQVSSLADAQLLELQNWVTETYHKKYVYEGVALGADHPSACPGLRGPVLSRRVDSVRLYRR